MMKNILLRVKQEHQKIKPGLNPRLAQALVVLSQPHIFRFVLLVTTTPYRYFTNPRLPHARDSPAAN